MQPLIFSCHGSDCQIIYLFWNTPQQNFADDLIVILTAKSPLFLFRRSLTSNCWFTVPLDLYAYFIGIETFVV
jgi:hypothetical protein